MAHGRTPWAELVATYGEERAVGVNRHDDVDVLDVRVAQPRAGPHARASVGLEQHGVAHLGRGTGREEGAAARLGPHPDLVGLRYGRDGVPDLAEYPGRERPA